MGIRKTIYISDETIWNSIQNAAKEEDRSVSNYLIWAHRNEQTIKKLVRSGKKTIMMRSGVTMTFQDEGKADEGHPDFLPQEKVIIKNKKRDTGFFNPQPKKK